MNKQALLNIDPATVGRFAFGGLAAGASASALVNLVHMVHQMKEDRKRRLKSDETDENTIVLTLPRKKVAEVTTNKPTKVISSTPEVTERSMAAISPSGSKQLRLFDGTYGTKMAAKGWPTLTASVLGMIGGGAAGMMVVDKLYQMQREKQLKRELDAAKQEYLDMLAGKQASAYVEDLFNIRTSDELTKEAEPSRTFGWASYPLAFSALLTILGTGGAAYLTKKILDEKLRASDELSTDIPKVKKIVFRSAPEPDVTKHASADDINAIKAAFVVMLDVVGGTDRFVGDPLVKAAMDECGLKAAQVKDTVQADVDKAISLFTDPANKGLVRRLLPHFESNPIKRWLALHTPLGGKAVGNYVRKLETSKIAQVTGSSAGAGSGQGITPKGREQSSRVAKKNIKLPPPWLTDKHAQDVSVTPIAVPSVVSALIGSASTPDPTDIAKAVVEETEKAEAAKRSPPKRDDIVIEAKDPAAKKYLSANQQKIVETVRQLVSEGKI